VDREEALSASLQYFSQHQVSPNCLAPDLEQGDPQGLTAAERRRTEKRPAYEATTGSAYAPEHQERGVTRRRQGDA
jgi:hypothetical protein